MSVGYRPGLDQVRAGELNRRVTLMSPNATPDSTGFVPRDAMTTVRTIWASIIPNKGQEMRESDREISELWVTIKCRYDAARDATEGWWIQQGTDNYDIRVIESVDQGRKMIQFTARLVK